MGRCRPFSLGQGGKPVSSSSFQTPAERVIKKYPNRRLYDTASSAYVTLAEIRDLVVRHEPVVVRDAKTGENITRSILLQIILEEEAVGSPMFSEAMLAQLIRFYGQAMQGFMGPFLEQQLQAVMQWQQQMAAAPQGLSPEAWGQFMGQWPGFDATQALAQMQRQLQKNAEHMMGAFGLKP